MQTKKLTENDLSEAATVIQNGGLVAFPTDTVYGLGADATNETAVASIFEAKGRPSDRPISVLVGDIQAMDHYALEVPDAAKLLAKKFWPGPLTIVLKSAGQFAPSVTAGKTTIGLRMPDNPIALAFIQKCGVPLATPSANTSGRPSPTQAEHVLIDLEGKIHAVIDGGATSYGLESTVLDFSNPSYPVILRPGNISKEAIEAVIQQEVFIIEETGNNTSSPGKHYEPNIPVYIVRSTWERAIEQMNHQGEKIGLLVSDEVGLAYEKQVETTFTLGKKSDLESVNKHFFRGLRYLEESAATVILAEPFTKGELGMLYMNRLEQAANKKNL